MWTPHWITVSCHGVEGPITTGYYCAIFPFCGGGKKNDDKKTKAFYDWATTGIPVIKLVKKYAHMESDVRIKEQRNIPLMQSGENIESLTNTRYWKCKTNIHM